MYNNRELVRESLLKKILKTRSLVSSEREKAMIDTVKLKTQHFRVKKIDCLEGVEYHKKLFPTLQKNGWQVGMFPGNREYAYLNLEDLNLDIRFNNVGHLYLYARCEVPRLLKGKGAIFYDSRSDLADKLNAGFLKAGLKVQLDKIKLGRLDLFKNIVMDGLPLTPGQFVTCIDDFLYGGRYKRSGVTSEEGAKTFSLYNNTRELCIYDKTSQMAHKYHVDIENLVARCEARIKKTRVLEKIGLGTFEDLDSASEASLKEKFNSEVKKRMVEVKKKIRLARPINLEQLELFKAGAWAKMQGGLTQAEQVINDLYQQGKIKKTKKHQELNRVKQGLALVHDKVGDFPLTAIELLDLLTY